MVAITVILAALVSFGANYGFHVYRTQETKRVIKKIENKYIPLFEDLHIKFMIIVNEMKKDKDELI